MCRREQPWGQQGAGGGWPPGGGERRVVTEVRGEGSSSLAPSLRGEPGSGRCGKGALRQHLQEGREMTVVPHLSLQRQGTAGVSVVPQSQHRRVPQVRPGDLVSTSRIPHPRRFSPCPSEMSLGCRPDKPCSTAGAQRPPYRRLGFSPRPFCGDSLQDSGGGLRSAVMEGVRPHPFCTRGAGCTPAAVKPEAAPGWRRSAPQQGRRQQPCRPLGVAAGVCTELASRHCHRPPHIGHSGCTAGLFYGNWL